MKKTGRTFLSLLLLLCYVQLAQAQAPVIFTPDTTFSTHHGNVTIPIQTRYFQDLTGLQFILSWDPSKLRFKEVDHFALDIEASTNFGLTEVEEGTLRFLWFARDLQPVALPDDATLFYIEFERTGYADEEISIQFKEDKLTRIEVYNDNFEHLPEAKFENGVISFASSSGHSERPSDIIEVTCAPNPFSETTRVDLSMKKTTTALISIIDITGRKIYEERRHFDKGDHAILLDSRIFPARGTYFYRVQAPQITVTQKMIFL